MTKKYSKSQSAIESRARRAAKHVGLRAIKRVWRRGSSDNYGQFMLINACNSIIAGARFDVSAEEVIDYCNTLK